MGIEYKSDRDKVRASNAEGGWDNYYGNEVETWELVLGAFSTLIPGGVGVAAWTEWQISSQLAKFGQSLGDLPRDLADQAIDLLKKIIQDGVKGEWNVGGLGIKSGVATYHHWWRLKPAGWNVAPSTYQPYVGFRLLQQIPPNAVVKLDAVEFPVPISTIFPTPIPSEPPASPFDTNEDTNWGFTNSKWTKT
ncbi:hypothetical protein V490_01387 [Pseudogymnoascus sp. VKM F-3557]|nr:hypothetical protein V490_01387 [Pseudogymnoascus sp. VKM F-3557]